MTERGAITGLSSSRFCGLFLNGAQQCGCWFDSRSRCHAWVEFVVGSRPCSERFFSGYSGFPLSSKNQHLQIPIRSSVPPISIALVHGYKIETIIKLFDFMSVYTKKWNVSLMTAYCLKK